MRTPETAKPRCARRASRGVITLAEPPSCFGFPDSSRRRAFGRIRRAIPRVAPGSTVDETVTLALERWRQDAVAAQTLDSLEGSQNQAQSRKDKSDNSQATPPVVPLHRIPHLASAAEDGAKVLDAALSVVVKTASQPVPQHRQKDQTLRCASAQGSGQWRRSDNAARGGGTGLVELVSRHEHGSNRSHTEPLRRPRRIVHTTTCQG